MFLMRLRSINYQCCVFFAKKWISTAPEDVTAALRPFYFAVHPDFLVQHPSEREVNENSLKHLSSFLDSLQNNRKPEGPSTLKFYLRQSGKDGSKDISFQAVNITLNHQSLLTTVQDILSICNIGDEMKEQEISEIVLENESRVNKCSFYRILPKMDPNTVQKRLGRVPRINLSKWLKEKVPVAKALMRGSHNSIRDTAQWCQLFKEKLGLKAIVWDNDASPLIHRKCCEDLSVFLKHYPSEMLALKGRTLVFGLETGIHLNGDIIFGYTLHKRHLWLQLLRSLPDKNEALKRLRVCERHLSSQLGGMNIGHLNSKPILDFNKHLYLLEKLTENISHYFQENRLTDPWNEKSQKLEVEFDSDISEPSVLKSGEMVFPLNVLPKDLITFILNNTSNVMEAIEHRSSQVFLEKDAQEKCLKALCLGSLSKDENLSSENMIATCERLITHHNSLKKFLQGSHVCITDHYITLEDGVMCIPWNWKDDRFS